MTTFVIDSSAWNYVNIQHSEPISLLALCTHFSGYMQAPPFPFRIKLFLIRTLQASPMTVLLSILAILFLVLAVGMPLLEKYSSEKSDEELGKITRYMPALMIILIICIAGRYFIG